MPQLKALLPSFLVGLLAGGLLSVARPVTEERVVHSIEHSVEEKVVTKVLPGKKEVVTVWKTKAGDEVTRVEKEVTPQIETRVEREEDLKEDFKKETKPAISRFTLGVDVPPTTGVPARVGLSAGIRLFNLPVWVEGRVSSSLLQLSPEISLGVRLEF